MNPSDKADPWDLLADELGIPPEQRHPEPAPQPTPEQSKIHAESTVSPPPLDKASHTEQSGITQEPIDLFLPESVEEAEAPSGAFPGLSIFQDTTSAEQYSEAPLAFPQEPLELDEAPSDELAAEMAGDFAGGVFAGDDFAERQEIDSTSPASAEEATGKRPSRRRRRRRRGSRGTDEAVGVEPVVKQPEVLKTEDQALPQDEAAAPGGPEPGRSKRRRSRRGSRKKKNHAELAASETHDAVEADVAVRESHVQPELPQEVDQSEISDFDETDDEKEESGKGGREGRTGHRAIPTWEEAVGVMIASNLEARAKKPSSGTSHGHPAAHGPREGHGPREQRRPSKKSRHKRK
jgi:hypothetical protein